ncbi:14060_t:CDS:2 [Acaulospora morrowiae]|uniref:14060_t:CDS:1 n=1 Tax=Acaulospora morrowiae TaxID=94023 RepID=A0A9N9AYH2_9GLOM|nr:14060_t:CDS:2 [Acaulospora morrowiae]
MISNQFESKTDDATSLNIVIGNGVWHVLSPYMYLKSSHTCPKFFSSFPRIPHEAIDLKKKLWVKGTGSEILKKFTLV